MLLKLSSIGAMMVVILPIQSMPITSSCESEPRSAIMVVILPVQSMPITSKVVSLSPAQSNEVCSSSPIDLCQAVNNWTCILCSLKIQKIT